jgi:hypothetical protein
MAGDDVSRRRRRGPLTDKRIALTAVVVSGVIGVAAPLSSYFTQVRATDAARQQNDLDELRALLDQALEDLTVLQARAFDKRRAWQRDPDAVDHQVRVDEAHSALRKAFEQTQADVDRIRIRLGGGGIYQVYWFAFHGFWEVGKCTRAVSPPDPVKVKDRDDEPYGLWIKAHEDGRHFSDLAYELVRSQLPDSSDTPSPDLSKARARAEQGDKALKLCSRNREPPIS